MSKVALSGNASGTGTFTIASPNGNTDRTINLPDSNGTILTTATPGVPVNGPAFSAYKSSNQSTSNSTSTKITFDVEEFDTSSCFASSAFTPTVAGYYSFTSAVAWGAGTGTANIYFMKNGSTRFKDGTSDALDSVANTCTAAALIYLNGSTDYVEVYGFQNSGGSLNAVGGTVHLTYFQAFLARSAT